MIHKGACGYMAIAHHAHNNRKKWYSALEHILMFILEIQSIITDRQVEFIKLFEICKRTNPENECEISDGELWLTSEIRKCIDSSHPHLPVIYIKFTVDAAALAYGVAFLIAVENEKRSGYTIVTMHGNPTAETFYVLRHDLGL